MKKRTIAIFLLLMFIYIVSNASADAVYTNDIDITNSNIEFKINETYSGNSSLNIRKGLDVDNNSNVNRSEINRFRDGYLKSKNVQLSNYISIDKGNTNIEMKSVDMEFENALGDVNKKKLYVVTEIKFDINSDISDGRHRIWIQGHPSIQNMEIILPKNMDVLSVKGLEHPEIYSVNGRVFVEGKSNIQKNNIGNTTQFEYATILHIYKKPFYEKMTFIASIFIILLILIAFASYMIQKNRK